MSRMRSGFVGAVSLVALAAVLSRLLGYVREMLLAAKFGATGVTDAYLVAQEIPGAIYFVVSSSLVLAFIPVYREVVERWGEEAAWRLVNTVLNVATLAFAALWLVGELAAPALIPLLAPGFSAESERLAVSLTRVMLPILLLVSLSGLSAGVLNAHRRFAAPAFFGLASNLVVVVTLLWVQEAGQISWVAYSLVGGWALGALIQLVDLLRTGYRYRPVMDLAEPALGRVWRMLLPVLVATSVTQVQTFAARVVASHLAEGTISFLNYAVRISQLPFNVIGLALTTVIYPTLAEQSASGGQDELKETLRDGLRRLAFLLVPMAVGTALFAVPIVRVVFERGAFTPDDTRMTAAALQFYAIGILFTGWVDMLNRTFYAVQDSLTPMWTALVMIAFNIVLNVALVGPLGHAGLALSASLAPFLGSLVLLARLRMRLGRLGGREIAGSLLTYLATSGAGALLGWLVWQGGVRFLGNGTLAQLILLILALGAIVVVHVAAALLLRTPDGAELNRIAGRLLRRTRDT